MKKYKSVAGWAKAFLILAVLCLFVGFTMTCGEVISFHSLQDYARDFVTKIFGLFNGWFCKSFPFDVNAPEDDHLWLYSNTRIIFELAGIIFLFLGLILAGAAFRRAGDALDRRVGQAITPSSTVVIGSTDESQKLIKEQAKEAKREEEMKKLAEIKAEREKKRAAKEAAKEAAKKAKEATAAGTDAVAKTAEDVIDQVATATKVDSSKKIDDILKSLK
jgi:hypothetical protein